MRFPVAQTSAARLGARRALGGPKGEPGMRELSSPAAMLVGMSCLHERSKQSPIRPDHPAPGMLAAYRQMVGGADTSAVWL